jgi:hypothetical protein
MPTYYFRQKAIRCDGAVSRQDSWLTLNREYLVLGALLR